MNTDIEEEIAAIKVKTEFDERTITTATDTISGAIHILRSLADEHFEQEDSLRLIASALEDRALMPLVGEDW